MSATKDATEAIDDGIPKTESAPCSSHCSTVLWFAIDPNDMVQTFDNPEAARGYAESALEFERDNAIDGWSEEVTNIMWGLVVESCEETHRRPREDGDVMIGSHIEEIVDYELVPCGDARLLVPEHTDVATENTAKKIVRRLHLAGIIKAGDISQARGMVIQALSEDATKQLGELQAYRLLDAAGRIDRQ